MGATINRALSLLSVIPIERVADIAMRLGISERYLNKLVVNAVYRLSSFKICSALCLQSSLFNKLIYL